MAKLNREPIVLVNENWCKRCGLCTSVCPFHVFEPNEEGLPITVNLAKCTECQLCELICPDFALEIGPRKHPHLDEPGEITFITEMIAQFPEASPESNAADRRHV